MSDYIFVFTIPLISFVITTLVFPKVLRFAKKHHIVVSPNSRKLQRFPTPVLGGVAVYLGFFIGYLVLASYQTSPLILWSLVAMTVMQIIGIWDDISDLSISFRFISEILFFEREHNYDKTFEINRSISD